MRTAHLLGLVAILLGVAAGVAFADEDGPLAPKSLSLRSLGAGTAISYNGTDWQTDVAGYAREGLSLVEATFVRGPARIHVYAGTSVEIPAGAVVYVSWEPAVRGWRFASIVGTSSAYFANSMTFLPEGRSITLTSGGEMYRAPNGYAPSRVIGLQGLPQVSGFRPFKDDRR